MSQWVSLGFDLESFWDQTARTIQIAYEGAIERRRLEHNDRAWLAWHVAAMSRGKRLPALRTLMQKRRPTVEETTAGLAAWVLRHGGQVIYKPIGDDRGG